MKANLTLALCFLWSSVVFSQNLLHSRQSSPFTYLYQISNAEAEQICRKADWDVYPQFFHTLRDSFPTDSTFAIDLPPGHYLQTSIVKNRLRLDLLTVLSFDVVMLNNRIDLCIAVYDTLGRVLPDAEVRVGNRRVPFDAPSQSYRLAKTNKKGQLSVSHGGLVAFYDLDRRWNNPRIRRVMNRPPMRYLYRPVELVVTSIGKGHQVQYLFGKIRNRIACLFDEDYCHPSREARFMRKWRGYLVFNKPIYQPGDTVRLKAFITGKRGRPLRDSISIVFFKDWNTPVTLGRIAPWQPGAYDFAFPLADSFRLELDENFLIALQNGAKKSYFGESFQYKDYELTGVSLAVRTDGDKQYRGKPFPCYLKGVDENELPLPDARVELTLIAGAATKFYASEVFLPDTLWHWTQALEPRGETTIAIPDSIFPPVDLKYELWATLLTSDNEREVVTKNLSFFHLLREFHFELLSDSVRFEYRENGQPRPAKAVLSGFDPAGEPVEERLVNLPLTEKINPYFASYRLDDGSMQQGLSLASEPAKVQLFSNRSLDSVHVICENPRQIPFRYFFYRGNRELERGYGIDLHLARPSGLKDTYFINLQYLWAGKLRTENYSINYLRRMLQVELDQPSLIYPGQESDITVTVTDHRGRPVPDADLTAYAVTQKFHPGAPLLPSFDKRPARRRLINSFSAKIAQTAHPGDRLDLAAWSEKTGLDTIEYYSFIYPGKNIYRYEYPAPDSITQFAPFVVNDGSFQPVQVVYVDRKPVYFGWSTNFRPYSFRVRPGYHQIELRTTDRLVRLDSLYFAPYQKLIFSLSDSVQSPRVHVMPMPNELTPAERKNLYRYIFPYRNTFKEHFPYLEQKGETQALWPNPAMYHPWGKTHLAGPVMSDSILFYLPFGYETRFVHEPHMEYEFAPELLKMRSISLMDELPQKLNQVGAVESLSDSVMTPDYARTQEQIAKEKSRRQQTVFPEPVNTPPGMARLVLYFAKTDTPVPLSFLFFQPGNRSFIRAYPGHYSHIKSLKPGLYGAIFLFPGGEYAILDSIQVKGGGLNYYAADSLVVLQPDSFSMRCDLFFEWYLDHSAWHPAQVQRELLELRELLGEVQPRYRKSYGDSQPGGFLEGKIYEESGSEVIGANVVLKQNGVFITGMDSDFSGQYSFINIEPGVYDMEVSYLGFSTQRITEINVESGRTTFLDVALDEEGIELSEMIVVSSFSALETNRYPGSRGDPARMASNFAGVSSRRFGISAPDSRAYISSIKGSRSDATVYFVDGIRVSGNLAGVINPSRIIKVEVITDESALAVFGPDAVGGVVLITTKDGAGIPAFDAAFLEGASESRSIRSRFSDYAFWEPRLRTDEEGKATFQVTFPDDITQWHTFVPAMTGKRQSGLAEGRISSFKPVAARLSLPRFLIAGDTAFVLGKALNYLGDTIELQRNFSVNEVETARLSGRIAEAATDSIWVSPQTADSLAVQYVIEKTDGYFDGEVRKIPVFPAGVERAHGQFFVLEGDTSVALALPDSLGPGTLYACADVLDLVEEDIAHLVDYEYDCNEQMASRLKALLALERIAMLKGEPFREKAAVNRLIKSLEKNRNEKGLWGWWNRSATVPWISGHVLESLVQARRQGYKAEPLSKAFAEEAVWVLESRLPNARKLEMLDLMNRFDVWVDFSAYLSALAQDTTLSAVNRFRLIELQQRHGLPWERDSVMRYRQETLMGNVFFSSGENQRDLETGDLQLTLRAYRILQRDTSASPDLLRRIRNYFLEYRSDGIRMNTYERAQVLEVLLDGWDKEFTSLRPAELALRGAIDQTVREFPLKVPFMPGDTLFVQKTGDYPVYLTAYQRYWDTNAREDDEHFSVRTWFADGAEVLKAGQPEKLVVEVTVRKEAEYALIEAPIPAGCSYASKASGFSEETHREYFKHKTVIFCEHLDVGVHRFEVELLPRYAGTFSLNPAKVELMYFPVFGANTGGKKVRIRR